MKKVKLIDLSVGGVKRPLINIHCKIDKNSKLKLVVDGDIIPLHDNEEVGMNYVNKILDVDDFIDYKYYANLPKKCKKILLYQVSNDVETLLIEKKVGLLIRIVNSIYFRTCCFFRKIIRIPRTVCKVIKLMWERHRFLIPPRLIKKYLKSFLGHITDNNIYEHFADPLDQKSYLEWIKFNDNDDKKVILKYKPLISIIVPVYNVDEGLLSECIDSVLNQTYSNFELCLADDCSTKKETIECLKKYEKKDNRVKVIYRKKNGHISEATNSAISIANGEYIGLLDNDDLLVENALYEVVKVLNNDNTIDMIYSDEDKIALNGKRYFPNFKPDFSPDTLLSSNYICHFTVLRKSIVDELGGFRSEYNGSQDYDMFLRFTEKSNKIYHIPKILYHWRMIEGSTSCDASSKNYAYIAGQKALEDCLRRRKIKGNVKLIGTPQMYEIEYLIEKEPRISIIIPTKDKSDILKRCLDSIYSKTNYENYEVIVIDNNSSEKSTFKLLDYYVKKYKNFKYYTYQCEFNYSYLNNEAVKKTKGEYVVLLNNDTEVISEDWLKKMVGYAKQEHIGCVGVKLLYPTETIQHCGVVIGCAGVAAHAFVGTGKENFGYFGRLIAPYNYSAVTAACLMVKKSKFNEVGGLDETLKVAYNDVDFNIKLLEKGYYNVVIPSVELYHHESISRGYDLNDSNKQRFINEVKYISNKWQGVLLNDRFYNVNLSKYYPFFIDRKEQSDEEE